MKLRLLEYLTCPDHPDEFLQLRNGHIAKLFDHAVEVRSPICRYYCGLGQGRFEQLPGEFEIDCQSCISMEIQWGTLACPVCGGFYALYEGIPVLSTFFPADTEPAADRLAAEFRFGESNMMEYRRTGPFARIADRREVGFVAENLDLTSIETVLYLGGATPAIIDFFCRRGFEVVVTSEEPHQLLRIHESELVNPSRLAFFVVTAPDLLGLKPASFDLVVSGHRLYGPHGYVPPPVGDLARATHKSGAVALTLYKDNPHKRLLHLCEGYCGKMGENYTTTDEFLDALPESLAEMEMQRHSSSLLDLIILRFPQSEPEAIRAIFHGDEAEAMINA
jgi:uncharacterized protein YbaR (Trm112 family)